MFDGCNNLEKLDVSYLNTNNSKSFREMFTGCSKLKEINVSLNLIQQIVKILVLCFVIVPN